MNNNNEIYASNNINSILFANNRDYFKKINKIMLVLVTILTSGVLFISDFTSKSSILQIGFFAIGLTLMMLYISTGYKWVSKSPVNFKQEKSWMWLMTILGLLMPFTKWLYDISIYNIFICFILYVFLLSIHSLISVKNQRNNNKFFYKKYIVFFNTMWFTLILLDVFLILFTKTNISKGIIVMFSFFFIAQIIFIISLFIFKDKTNKRSLPISSIRTLLVAFILGTIIWSIKVFIIAFDASLIPYIGALVQVLMMIWISYILVKGKDDFAKNFVKGYLMNVGFFIQLLIVLFVQSIIIQFNFKGTAFINEVLLGVSAIVFYGILIKKQVLRSNKYNNIDLFILWSLSISLLFLSILEHEGIFEGIKAFNIDGSIIGIVAVLTGINLLYSAIDWSKSVIIKIKEKTWV